MEIIAIVTEDKAHKIESISPREKFLELTKDLYVGDYVIVLGNTRKLKVKRSRFSDTGLVYEVLENNLAIEGEPYSTPEQALEAILNLETR